MSRSKASKSGPKKAAAAGEADGLAERLRATLPAKGRSERRMFGGIGFMLNGNMIAGASKRGLLLRVGKENNEAALKRPGARPMEMRGKPIEGYIRIDAMKLGDKAFGDWIDFALAFVRTLPAKTASSKPNRTKGERA